MARIPLVQQVTPTHEEKSSLDSHIARQERRARVLDLRAAAVPYVRIARELGIAVNTARADFETALAEVGAESAQQTRALYSQRYDAQYLTLHNLIAVHRPRALGREATPGSDAIPPDPDSAAIVIAAVRAQAFVSSKQAVLMGSNAPIVKHVDVKHTVGGAVGMALLNLDDLRVSSLVQHARERRAEKLARSLTPTLIAGSHGR